MAEIQERTGFIGGSDMSDVLQIAPYGCRLKLFREKRGEESAQKAEGGVLDRGKELETIVADRAASMMDWKIKRCSIRVGPQDWHRAQIDRMIMGDPRGPGALECKTMSQHIYRKAMKEGLPEGYIAQLQWQLHCSGWKWGAFAILQPDTWQFQIFEMPRDEEMIAQLVIQSNDFIRLVENGPMPEKQEPTSRACGRCGYFQACHGDELIQLADAGKAGEAEQDESVADVVSRYRDACDIVGEAEEFKEAIRKELEAALNQRLHVACSTGRVLWSACKRESIDTKRLKAELPDVASKYTKATAYRQLRVYPA